MTLLNALVTSSVVALGVLVNSASPANALVAQGGHLNARTPNHNGVIKRKRSSHKNRKRCVQQQPLPASGSSVSVAGIPDPTDVVSPPAVTTPAVTTPVYQGNPAQGCGNGAKVGLAWGPTMPSDYIPNAITSKTCWYYNWSAWAADSSLTGNLKFVPMLWGPDSTHTGEFQSQVINSATNYGIALAMNEVNQDGQANMPASQGVDVWNQYLVPLKSRGYTIISPSTTSAPSGIQWMQDWLGGGLQANPDALAMHWYGTSFDDFHSYVEQYCSTFPNYPVWITEFACTDFNGGGCDTMAFANQAIPYLEGKGQIQAYFPFAFDGTMSNVGEPSRLMNTNGVVTDLGWRYLN